MHTIAFNKWLDHRRKVNNCEKYNTIMNANVRNKFNDDYADLLIIGINKCCKTKYGLCHHDIILHDI